MRCRRRSARDVDLPEAPLEAALGAIAARIGVDEHTTNEDADRKTRAFLAAHPPPPGLLAEAATALNAHASTRARRDAALALVRAATSARVVVVTDARPRPASP